MACAQVNVDRRSDPDAAYDQVIALEKQVFPEGLTAGSDTILGLPYVRAAQAFADEFRDDSRSPELLMKAAGVASGVGFANKSIQLWGYVWRRYPDHEQAPNALFFQGYVFDTQYGDYPQAVTYYNRFLKYFPDHELAEQVQQLLAVAEAGGELPPVPTAPNN